MPYRVLRRDNDGDGEMMRWLDHCRLSPGDLPALRFRSEQHDRPKRTEKRAGACRKNSLSCLLDTVSAPPTHRTFTRTQMDLFGKVPYTEEELAALISQVDDNGNGVLEYPGRRARGMRLSARLFTHLRSPNVPSMAFDAEFLALAQARFATALLLASHLRHLISKSAVSHRS